MDQIDGRPRVDILQCKHVTGARMLARKVSLRAVNAMCLTQEGITTLADKLEYVRTLPLELLISATHADKINELTGCMDCLAAFREALGSNVELIWTLSGEKMGMHPSMSELVLFALNNMLGDQRETLQNHLDDGCATCKPIVDSIRNEPKF